jgi:hypothetical protein
MKMSRWQYRFAAALTIVAVLLYAARLLLFPGAALRSEMWRFLLGDVAFLFVQVPLVSLVIDGIIRRRELEETRRKLNMVIGAFFSETGQRLLGDIARADARLAEVQSDLTPTLAWKPADYERARTAFAAHKPSIEFDREWLERMRDALARERGFLIGLLANQTLLEHERFSDLLWALTHVGEELAARPDLGALTAPDHAHLANDVARAYTLLGTEWLAYLQHLEDAYPFLFSLAVRTNPLDPSAAVEVAG